MLVLVTIASSMPSGMPGVKKVPGISLLNNRMNEGAVIYVTD